MAKVREIRIVPPVGGVVKAFAFQDQPPFTTPDALNFWPRDAKNGRKRPSIRPRLVTTGSGMNSAVRSLAQVNVATQQTLDRGLFGISGGTLYRYSAGSYVSESGRSFSTDRYVSMAAFLQDLYIADDEEDGTPSVYSCTADTLGALSASAGDEPTNVTIVTAWNDCLVWAGDTTAPHAWYMSAQGSPLDYDYTQTTRIAAVNGTTLDGGLIGEKVTALISHNRACLIFCGTDSTHVLRGHPRQGGRMEVLSHVVGALGQGSFCKTGDDQTVFLTRNGLYVMPPGCGSALQALSRQRIPDDLMGIDTGTFEGHLGYDARFNGIQIYVTETAGASTNRQAWWLDWEDGGYWPMELTTTEQPLSVLRFDPLDGDDESGTLLGGSGGGARRFDRTSTASISDGYLYLGPIRISPTRFHKGIIQKMTVVFSSNTTDTAGVVSVYCAEDGEAAYDAAVADTAHRKFSQTIANCQNNTVCYPRVGGHAAVLKIELTGGDKHIALEEITLSVMDAGVMR